MSPAGFVSHDLGDGLTFLSGSLPPEWVWTPERFDHVWNLHPAEKPVIHMPGGLVQTPRWQQAFGADYHFSGQTSTAAPVPPALEPLRAWARGAIHRPLNGLLLNWYDGPGHYIGPHHDSTRDMVADAPIVTISFGETRTFRLTRGKEKRDFEVVSGAVFVLPYSTNLAWKHAVPKSARYRGRRISVTLRAFHAGA